jgi:hypothetical protein
MAPLLITVILGVGGYIFVAYEDRVNEQHRIVRERAEARIQEKMLAYGKVLRAILGLREVREEIRMACEHDPKLASDAEYLHKSNIRRYESRVEVVKALVDVYFVFGKTINDEIVALVQGENNLKNVCSSDAPPDGNLMKTQFKVETEMRDQIEADEASLKQL